MDEKERRKGTERSKRKTWEERVEMGWK